MSASSPSTSVEPCLVCDQPGKLLCSGRKRARFCSSRCQRILWPVHKASCGRNVDSLYLPPLTPDELVELERRREQPQSNGMTLSASLATLYPGVSWSTFVTAVSSTEASIEAFRNELIAFAHFELFAASTSPPPVETLSAWQDFGATTFNMIAVCNADNAHGPPPRWSQFEACRRLDGALRRELVTAAVLQACRDGRIAISASEGKRLLKLCIERTVQEVERADLSQTAKDLLVGQARVQLWQM